MGVIIKTHIHTPKHTQCILFNPWSHVQCYTVLLYAEEIPKGF